MANKLILVLIFIFGSLSFAQQNNNKTATNDISIARADTALQTGSRKKGKNPGNQLPPQFRVTTKQYVTRSSFQKVGPGHEVRIKILKSGTDNTDIEDFAMAYEHGTEYRTGNTVGIDNITFPFYNKVTYRSWNSFHAVQFDVRFEFTIYDPGVWDVTIYN
jgi:hypothetical protein